MKEVPKKDLPEVSGGENVRGGCIPTRPPLPLPDDDLGYPKGPFLPFVEESASNTVEK